MIHTPRMKRLTPEDWDDVADLLMCCVDMCAESTDTHTRASCQKAAEWCDKMMMRAHDKGARFAQMQAQKRRSTGGRNRKSDGNIL